ncbi:hypothetical protein HK102_007533, partial [Quaeritorhiza haematococci]
MDAFDNALKTNTTSDVKSTPTTTTTAALAPVPRISRHDEDILNRIFNPDSGFAPIDDNADDDVEPPTIDPETLERVKAIEVEALDLAERKNDLDGTIEKLSEAIG